MNYCFSKEQILGSIEILFYHHDISDPIINKVLEMSSEWSCKLEIINYFFLQALDHLDMLSIAEKKTILNFLKNLEDCYYFVFEEFSPSFIDYLLRNVREEGVSLSDALLATQRRYSEYDYSSVICY